MKPKLVIAATPIDGNWKELDPRLIRAVQSADFLIAEEKRNALRLLTACGCNDKPFMLLNEHSTDKDRAEAVEQTLQHGLTVFVSDAGTPCLADPDHRFVEMCIKEGAEIKSVPGASSIAAALSVSGFPTDKFTFMGFPPRDKNKRKQFFAEIAASKHTTVFLERPYALRQTLSDMQPVKREVCLCVALGTDEEMNIRGSIADISPKVEGLKQVFAVVVSPSQNKAK